MLKLNRTEEILFALLQMALHGQPVTDIDWKTVTEQEWKEVFLLSIKQGVRAVAFDGIGKIEIPIALDKGLKMKWVGAVMGLENAFHKKKQAASDFAAAMDGNSLHTMVLKGLSFSTYYPEPSHREFGDLDCYIVPGSLPDVEWGHGYEQGNVVAENIGAAVRRSYYKHSHISYKGLAIENHQYFLPIRGKKADKALERHLRSVAFPSDYEPRYVGESKLLIPSADFNALFMTAHSMNHFLYETIRLRHVCDWALLLKAEQDRVDWESFYRWCDKMHYTRFVNCLNYICHHCLGIELCDALKEDAGHAALVLNEIWRGENLYNRGYGKFVARILLVKNFFQSSWKYRKICQRSALGSLLTHGVGVLFDRNPTV